MWFLRHCLAYTANCQPSSWADLAEYVTAVFLAILAAIVVTAGVVAALDRLDGWL